ncbi:MAG: flagellar hook assembly protein FlgD [Janthinobacterium lividum]
MPNAGPVVAPPRNTSNIRPDIKRAEEAYEKMKTEVPGEQDKTKAMLTGNFDDWVKLLVATIKYQDPTDPMDTSEMAAQMTAFGQLNAMMEMREELKKASALQADSQLLEASSQIDRMMEFNGNKFSFTKDQASEINFTPPAESKFCSLIISDDQNRVVDTRTIETKAEEKNSFKWDGKLRDGKTAGYGSYQIKVVPFDENKQILMNPKTKKDYDIATTIKDIAKSGIREKGMPMIVLGGEGGASYPLGSMMAIHANQEKTFSPVETKNDDDLANKSEEQRAKELASENPPVTQAPVEDAQVNQVPLEQLQPNPPIATQNITPQPVQTTTIIPQNMSEGVSIDGVLNNLASKLHPQQ